MIAHTLTTHNEFAISQHSRGATIVMIPIPGRGMRDRSKIEAPFSRDVVDVLEVTYGYLSPVMAAARNETVGEGSKRDRAGFPTEI